ncbi:MAG: class I SAM-dependent methyltransferase [Mycobacterium sp.]|nr:class I SAM-dependent methyltransferase [Mycobacterium sp.]
MPDINAHDDTHAGARHFCSVIRARLEPEHRRNVFVAGCGLGHEALHIRKTLDVPVTGADISRQWDANLGGGIDGFTLLENSILSLPFANDTFDAVFYHHVIEHVSDPRASLAELFRILVPGGLIYVGTPNRHRAIGYLGSPDASRSEKIEWNIIDYKARLRGKFRNEHGAHAGFTEKELDDLLDERFINIEFLTADYLHFKYDGRLPGSLLNLICRKPLIEVAAPSVYAVATKPAG